VRINAPEGPDSGRGGRALAQHRPYSPRARPAHVRPRHCPAVLYQTPPTNSEVWVSHRFPIVAIGASRARRRPPR
jgi:hypothetical protein